MSRPLRIQFPGAVYHVMNRGGSRQATFLNDDDYHAFLDTLAEVDRLWGIEVFAYCLMKNHYHVCLRTPKGNLSRVMRHVDGLYTQRFNRHHRRDGSLFRGRYKAILIDADEYLSAVVRYIHLNPVAAGIVTQPQDYRWGSHRYYLQSRTVPIWLNTAQALEQIGERKAFHEFVLSGNEQSLEEYYKSERRSPILGGEAFIERVKQPAATLPREYPRYERRAVQANDPERVVRKIVEQYKVKREEIFRSVRGHENEARKVAMYLVKRCCDRTLPEIADYFGTNGYATVSWNCRFVESKMAKEMKFKDWIEKIAASTQL